MATIKEIAQLSGFSINTVSRALRKSGYVSKKASDVITKIAKELNYYPNQAACRLRNNRSNMIVIISESTDTLNIEKITAIQNFVTENAIFTNLCLVSYNNYLNDLKYIKEMIFSEKPAGIICLGTSDGLIELAQTIKTVFPIVFIPHQPMKDFDCVYIDRTQGVADAVKYLYQNNRRHIAISRLDSAKILGYQNAIKELNLQEIYPPLGNALKSEDIRQDCQIFVQNLKKMTTKIDAILCSDYYANILVAELMANGINVPLDIAVFGFDNRDIAEFCQVPLSTIAQPNKEVGIKASELLLERIKNKNNDNIYKSVKIPMKLIIRKST